jgi:hypothetical protein
LRKYQAQQSGKLGLARAQQKCWALFFVALVVVFNTTEEVPNGNRHA